MRAFIIEDEAPARAKLIRLLSDHCPDVKVVGQVGSITSAVKWLKENSADVILMDVELSDGLCFEIFNRVEVKGKVIITTAYDSYAIRAFKVNSVDYILKPIVPEELVDAIGRCREPLGTKVVDMALVAELLKGVREIDELAGREPKRCKERFSTQIGDRIISVESVDIAYFYAADKATYIATIAGGNYILDSATTLDKIEELVDPRRFRRVSRNCIIAFDSIASVSKYFDGKLKIKTTGGALKEVIVSRLRAQSILEWLDGG